MLDFCVNHVISHTVEQVEATKRHHDVNYEEFDRLQIFCASDAPNPWGLLGAFNGARMALD
jgi:hypothetical protein